MDFSHNRTWPVFYDYIPVYEIWIQYITVFKRYSPETIFHSEIKGHNSDNNWWILSIIELDLYFMIMYLCLKYESNTPMFSKDIARKPFFIRTGQDVRTEVRTRVMLYAPHYKWRGHKNMTALLTRPWLGHTILCWAHLTTLLSELHVKISLHVITSHFTCYYV